MLRRTKPSNRVAFVVVATWMSACAQVGQAQLASGDPASNFELGTWASDLDQVTDLAFLSDGRAVVTLKPGKALLLAANGKVLNASALSIEVDSQSEKGLLGVVADENDDLYFYASTGSETKDKHHIYKGRLDATGNVKLDTSKSIIGMGLEGPANHDGGGMIIHKGQLFVGVGDTGHNNTPPTNRYATCLNRANGKILRVNLDGSIPADNPLADVSMVTGCDSHDGDFSMVPPDKRIYAWGLRNPWRLFIDPKTDLLWIGDVGEVTQEEITVGGKGVHHGWPFYEGTRKYDGLGGLADCSQVVPATECVAPQYSYPRSDGISVTGGLIPPEGCGWGDYEQRYFFADYGSSHVWTLDLKADRSGAVANSRRDFATVASVVSFRMGKDGAMYLAGHDRGVVTRIAPKNVPDGCKTAAAQTPTAPASDAGEPLPAPSRNNHGGCGCSTLSPHPAGNLISIALGLLLATGLRRRNARPHAASTGGGRDLSC